VLTLSARCWLWPPLLTGRLAPSWILSRRTSSMITRSSSTPGAHSQYNYIIGLRMHSLLQLTLLCLCSDCAALSLLCLQRADCSGPPLSLSQRQRGAGRAGRHLLPAARLQDYAVRSAIFCCACWLPVCSCVLLCAVRTSHTAIPCCQSCLCCANSESHAIVAGTRGACVCPAS